MISREEIEAFIEERRIQLVIITAAVLVLLVILLLIGMVLGKSSQKSDSKDSAGLQKNSIPLNTLWMASEPLSVPGLQLFREPPEKWSAEDVKRWYTIPDEQSLGSLRVVSQKQIDALLESVP